MPPRRKPTLLAQGKARTLGRGAAVAGAALRSRRRRHEASGEVERWHRVALAIPRSIRWETRAAMACSGSLQSSGMNRALPLMRPIHRTVVAAPRVKLRDLLGRDLGLSVGRFFPVGR
jgi:hypothetical protein